MASTTTAAAMPKRTRGLMEVHLSQGHMAVSLRGDRSLWRAPGLGEGGCYSPRTPLSLIRGDRSLWRAPRLGEGGCYSPRTPQTPAPGGSEYPGPACRVRLVKVRRRQVLAIPVAAVLLASLARCSTTPGPGALASLTPSAE